MVYIFNAITNFQRSLSSRCHRGYEDTIARIIREQLEIIFYKMLLNEKAVEEVEALKTTAVILSWDMYDASLGWRKSDTHLSPEEFIKRSLPYLMAGVKSASNY
ncbi:hypothetical protein GWK91_06770 [Virgibacillus sp. MSP4-1]|uniref:hypothetical protein n=1 Tax=Virgibacillus sp. MSP4-1 TaxID=2700081 RepID=UPI0003A25EC4|nr:hypothetical protein [Virgibacillus sp. MSP4-1]QHS22665.1 hypothetical protein GWK91_06770 [Virgibacillus sp. MSP4-1]